MTRYKVAYYAHHHGSGHLRHAQRLADLDCINLQVASTGARQVELLRGPLEYVALPDDTGLVHGTGPRRVEDPFHYVPVGAGIRQRFATLNQAWNRFVPDVVMVDVSVEVAVFARLSGYPVAFRRMPGNRGDPAHQMAYSLSDAIFGYFPSTLEDPEQLEAYGAKSHYLTVPEPAGPPASSEVRQGVRPRRVVVQTSLASSLPLRDVASAARASPRWQWEVAGAVEKDGTPLPGNLTLHGVLDDPGPVMNRADLLISSAGHNAVVAAAACRRPVFLIPEERPYDEQLHFARSLQAVAGIPMLGSWSAPTDWPALLERSARSDPGALAGALFGSDADFASGLGRMLEACVRRAEACAGHQ